MSQKSTSIPWFGSALLKINAVRNSGGRHGNRMHRFVTLTREALVSAGIKDTDLVQLRVLRKGEVIIRKIGTAADIGGDE